MRSYLLNVLLALISTNLQTDAERLLLMDQQWNMLIASHDTAGALNYFDAEAKVFVANGPVLEGKSEIRKFLENFGNKPSMTFSAKANSVSISSSGDMAYLTGTFASFSKGTEQTGKYVTIWRKTNNDWKIMIDIFNSN